MCLLLGFSLTCVIVSLLLSCFEEILLQVMMCILFFIVSRTYIFVGNYKPCQTRKSRVFCLLENMSNISAKSYKLG